MFGFHMSKAIHTSFDAKATHSNFKNNASHKLSKHALMLCLDARDEKMRDEKHKKDIFSFV